MMTNKNEAEKRPPQQEASVARTLSPQEREALVNRWVQSGGPASTLIQMVELALAATAPASPTPPTGTEKKKDAEPVVHQGMTIAGDGAAMLGRLMREQRASRLGVYPDGNPNAGTEKP